MITYTRFLALLIAVLTVTAGAALGSIAIDDVSLTSGSRDAGASAEETENDAGSGGDAGNSKDKSLRLHSPGGYKAHFKDLDSDWYVHGSGESQAACIETSATGERLATSNLQTQSLSGARSITATGGTVTFGFAATSLEDLYFAYSTDGTKSGERRYDFVTSVLATSDVTSDAGGTDASGTLVGATTAPQGCFGGTIAAESGDATDVYTFKGRIGESVVFTFAQGPGLDLELSLARPDGSVIGKTGSDGSIATTLDTDGDWFLIVQGTASGSSTTLYRHVHPLEAASVSLATAESDTDYTVGACRPFCEE